MAGPVLLGTARDETCGLGQATEYDTDLDQRDFEVSLVARYGANGANTTRLLELCVVDGAPSAKEASLWGRETSGPSRRRV